jgi:hypothetical protein
MTILDFTSRFREAGFSEEAKRQWREAHWEEDLIAKI